MKVIAPLHFDQADLGTRIDALTASEIDALDFGVIGFDARTRVTLYNAFEAECAGLTRGQVVGELLFADVAACMNNFMVAQRFEDTASENGALDETLNYVLTLRMRPVKVRLRLIASPNLKSRYVLVFRQPA